MKGWATFLALLLWTTGAFAENVATPSPEEPVKYNIFGRPEQVLRQIGANNKGEGIEPPAVKCDDANLLSQVLEELARREKNPEENIVDRRHRLLAAKNLKNFSEISAETFKPEDNYRVANRLIATKINHSLRDKELRLCVSDNPVLARKVYLLIYELSEGTRVEIINYTADEGKVEPFILLNR